MEKVKLFGIMELILMVILKKAKRLRREFLNGGILHIMRVNFSMKIFMDMVNIIGKMAKCTKEIG